MNRLFVIFALLLGVAAVSISDGAQSPRKLELQYADETEFIFSKLQDTTFVTGSVVFETETGMIYCDSAMWSRGDMAVLWGRVIIDDKEYRLVADSVRYNLRDGRAVARGSYVELWSRNDSLLAVGTHAFFDRGRKYFHMLERPTVYLNYPDSGRMIEVIADYVQYDGIAGGAEAEGAVKISSKEFSSTSGCAVMHPQEHTLDLFDSPAVTRGRSEIRGRFITVASDEHSIRRVDVIDSASGVFLEPTFWNDTVYDRSKLSGRRILMDFLAGDLRTVTCYGQAYSWYNPASMDLRQQQENSVSGDTIRFTVSNEQLQDVEVIGGAIGTYLSTTKSMRDTVVETRTDTIYYEADHISYDLLDSLITLKSRAKTRSKATALEAYRVQFDTKERIIKAYSGSIKSDTAEDGKFFGDDIQPNDVPVTLADGNQQLLGDYLRYSIDTEKGRIVTSKSNYQTGLFYGEQLHRQHKDIYYLENGRYTTCDADEPHFHFSSKNLKLIEGKRLIARPVVMSIGRLPILAIPYYVFPLEKGRHSGILPFTLGNIERGERYIRNIGYYWAASDYWDWKGAVDYYEERDRLNLYSSVAYNKLYAFNGSVTGNWGRETSLDTRLREYRTSRWTLKATHNQDFTPSFRVSASGDIRSDAKYYNDYSTNLDERLNRVVRSSVNFTKKFGKSVSMSGTISHDDQLDTKSRTDHLPTMNITLPALHPFGSGGLDENGAPQRHWYNELVVTYRPRLENFSSRVTRDSLGAVWYDTTHVTDSTNPDSIVVTERRDTLSYRSRKEYSRVDHSLSASFPLTVAKYFIFNPTVSYAENWMLIHETDQSRAKNIDASTTYRTFSYNAGTSLSTTIYGTVYPRLFGLEGLRQAVSPEIGYQYSPKSDRHPVVSAYAGASARTAARSQELTFSLKHLYQAKIRQGEKESNLELVSVRHSFSYDFEEEKRKISNLSSSAQSNLLKNIRVNADMIHSFYKSPTSDEFEVLNPHLSSFQVNAVLSLRGKRFLFDEPAARTLRMGDSAAPQGLSAPAPVTGAAKGWDMSATYSYSESGKFGGIFKKSSALRLSLDFGLTSTTQVRYSQYYDIAKQKTISNEVRIIKTLHCWTGTFHWVPTGSTRGWGFMLYVTAMPEIKIDNSQSSLNSSYFQGLQ